MAWSIGSVRRGILFKDFLPSCLRHPNEIERFWKLAERGSAAIIPPSQSFERLSNSPWLAF